MAHGFERQGDVLETKLEPLERVMIAQLLTELRDLLTRDDDANPNDSDPLARELGLESLGEAAVAEPDSPVVARLLPDGYRDDPIAAHEFRRYTDAALRRGKIEDAEVVLAGIARADEAADGSVVIAEDEAEIWLRAINDLRLALGVRLEVTADSARELAAIPDDDPRAAPAAIYDFLTWWQDSLVRALVGDLD